MLAWQQYLQTIRERYSNNPRSAPCYAELESFFVDSHQTGLQYIRHLDLKRSTNISQSNIPSKEPINAAKIFVLEGFPCPFLLGILGHEYQIQPELLINHLDLRNSQHLHSFDFPALPSERNNRVHIRLITLIGTTNPHINPAISKLASLKAERKRVEKASILRENSLFHDKRYGDSMIRKVHLHSKHYYSIEQLVSLTISENHSQALFPWTAVVLMDNGRPLLGSMPWQDYSSGTTRQIKPIPMLSYRNTAPTTGTKTASSTTVQQEPLHPYHPFQILAMEDADSVRADPFLLLCHLCKEASTSWAQVFNFLDQDISRSQYCSTEESATALEQLRFNMGLIERFRSFLLEDREAIRQRGSPSWPRSRQDSKEMSRVDALQKSLLIDYDYLLDKAEHMSKRCEVSSGILMNAIAVLEAQKNIQQAAQVNKLTRLAFGYIPVSFVASFFGMNVKEIAGQFPPIWVFFVVAVPITALSILLASSWKFF